MTTLEKFLTMIIIMLPFYIPLLTAAWKASGPDDFDRSSRRWKNNPEALKTDVDPNHFR